MNEEYFKADDAQIDRYIGEYHAGYTIGQLAREVKELRALSRPLANGGEAVAWRYHYGGQWFYVDDKPFPAQPDPMDQPLYTHPAQPVSTGDGVVVKALKWREIGEGYGGFIGGTVWTRVDHGWNLAQPYEYRGERFSSLEMAKEKAEADHQAAIRSCLTLSTSEASQPVADETATIDKAMDCSSWPKWLSDAVDLTNEASDAADMSTEQAVAYGILQALKLPAPSPEASQPDAREVERSARAIHAVAPLSMCGGMRWDDIGDNWRQTFRALAFAALSPTDGANNGAASEGER